MDEIDVEKVRVKTPPATKPKSHSGIPRHRKGEKFLAGPIPWNWLIESARLPGKPINVAVAIWHLVFVKKTSTIQLQGAVLRDLRIPRKSAYRALKALEAGGLITCDRGPGRRPIITVLSIPEEINGNGNESRMTGEYE